MGYGDDSKKITRTAEMENLSLDVSTKRFSRDLLQRFMGSASEFETVKEEDEEIELNLGLSLGGGFGEDKSSKKLVRSSSIASCLPGVRDDNDAVATPTAAYTGLGRASSLPLETEEWRRRKELQNLRRMEAKRRRSEKQKNLKGDTEGGGSGGRGSLSLEERKEIEVNLRERLEREKCLVAVKRLGSSEGSQVGLSAWAAAAATQAILRGGIDVAMAKGKGSYVGTGGKQGFGEPASQGSLELKGRSSSGVSDLERSSGELSPASMQSLQEGSNQDIGSSGTKTRENMSRTTGSETESPSKKSDTSRTQGRTQGREIATNSMEDMPCVFTKGGGPYGRRVDGILYKYGRGEEVRIMCICHGSFHSPAEFVKHAGGPDVDHPLRHIVVNWNSSSLL